MKKKHVIIFSIVVLAIATIFGALLFSKNIEHDWGIVIDEQLIESINLHRASFAVQANENIFFSQFDSESLTNSNGKLYKMSLDGNTITKLADIPGRFLTIEGDQLYFTDCSNSSKLCVLNTKEGTYKTLYDDAPVFQYLIIDKWIYFLEKKGEGYGLSISRIDKSGHSYERLIDGKDCSNIIYDGEFIYYTDMANVFQLYKLNLETLENQEIFSGYNLPYGVSGDNIILDGGPVVLDLNSLKMVKLIPENHNVNADQFNFYDGSLLYTDLKQILYSFNGEEHELIYDEYAVTSFSLVGDWLFIHVAKDSSNPSLTSLIRLNLLTGEIKNF